MKIIPSIDIVSKRVARLYMGDISKTTVYQIKPIDALRRWEREGAEIIHLVDIDAAYGRGSNMETILHLISEASVEVQVAGGIRSLDKALMLIESGAARVVIGTIFIEKPEITEDMIRQLGSDKLIVALDHYEGRVAIRGWEKITDRLLIDEAKRAKEMGFKWILVSSITRDGTLAGIDDRYVELVAKMGELNVIAAGGVSSIEDVEKAKKAGAYGLIIGRALYDGLIDLKEAIKVGKDC
ncbi:MAG: 1-(5-phosphoribosyl)-5-[(5-phosphoribosylamino)methylideneamino] imidazole-4-carboxamide isomerase [Candidatus Nezhaarchaeota archaeon]|nr:1-(5-phosphoribosyl)-5-[(5-phosphoribosylamino)methylideneamino] imidazole-4-carboxamide isomerase [Candidatus Nezhaarchaeota archaeon]MCX8141308.1 1-(5-phosphoribosyl)-5-[(5-phosphoribosylamino)methylideneamino] imidazole-4-carboxamide isomerase [Candidatus Nezhaarchaeota archaeon]MDW8049574.1 1-(5-phosphoribosyl)-5-[(5-phosphoribosylamino)methylideneamino] imidazole-4-carboxamide isomerase [Nitrososphaerota archaeon]